MGHAREGHGGAAVLAGVYMQDKKILNVILCVLVQYLVKHFKLLISALGHLGIMLLYDLEKSPRIPCSTKQLVVIQVELRHLQVN